MRQGPGEPSPRTYTFLYTDIVGSSRLWEADPGGMAASLSAHNEILERLVSAGGGRVFKSLGDGLACVFDAADAAVRCAVEIQRAITAANLAGPIEIRIGIHSGTAHPVGNDFGGPVLNRVSRITDLAEGGQIFVSEAVQSLAPDYLGGEIFFDSLGEVVLDGMNRPERIFCVRAEGLRGALLFTSSDELPPSNLEALERPFIGRAAERKDLCERLRNPEQRLITIAGFGGMGKTTLARRCGLDVLDDFENKVFWIECEPIRTRDELAAAALLALGQGSESGDAESSLLGILGDQSALLIFDCFENIVTLGGFLDRLARKCPNLKILVTSRIVLGAEAEYLLELGGMSGKHSARMESDAVELFLSHAVRHTPAFGKTTADRSLVRRLVRELEFVPLAIVICAGRLRYTPIKALHEQVQSSLLGTVRSVRDQVGRHSGLARVIQMSFDLLDPGDQRVLEALAIFEGTFALDAASAVLGGELPGAEQSIIRLRDNSLVAAGEHDRMRLLDSVREFLGSVPNEGQPNMMARFVSYYEVVATHMRQLGDSADWASVAKIWRTEAPNLRAALRYSQETETDVARIALPLMRVLLESGLSDELLFIAHSLLKSTPSQLGVETKIDVLGLVGISHRRRGQFALAKEMFKQRADLCLSINDATGAADSLLDLSVIAIDSNDANEGLRIANQVQDMGVTAGHILSSSLAAIKSLCHAKLGNRVLAMQYLSEAEQSLQNIPQAEQFVNKTLSLVLAECGHRSAAVGRLVEYAKSCLNVNYFAVAGSSLLEIALLLNGDSQDLASEAANLAIRAPGSSPRIVGDRLRKLKGQMPIPPQGRGRHLYGGMNWESSTRDFLQRLQSQVTPVWLEQSSS